MFSRQQAGQGVLYLVGGVLVVGFIVLMLVFFSGAQVNAGYVGVVSIWGAIEQGQQPLTPGFHLVMPFSTHIQSVSTQPQNHTFKEVGAASKELQNVYVDGGVNYHIDTSAAAKITIAGGVDAIVSKVFDPAFQDYIKEVVPTYAVVDILANRSQIRDAVKSRLAEKAAPYGITVDDVFITNIHFDKDFEAAIEAKQIAAQNLEQARIQALNAVVTAKGLADAKVAQAEGDAEANRLRREGLSALLIQWLIIDKWNGVLPQVTGGASPFISVTPK